MKILLDYWFWSFSISQAEHEDKQSREIVECFGFAWRFSF